MQLTKRSVLNTSDISQKLCDVNVSCNYKLGCGKHWLTATVPQSPSRRIQIAALAYDIRELSYGTRLVRPHILRK